MVKENMLLSISNFVKKVLLHISCAFEGEKWNKMLKGLVKFCLDANSKIVQSCCEETR